MKNFLLIWMLLIFSSSVFAEGPIHDPWDIPTIHLTCTYPIEREDGTPLLLTEIGNVNFYMTGPNSVSPVGWETDLGANIVACENFVDISALPDGQYYVTATVTDTDGRTSVYATDPTVTIGAYAFEIQSYIKPPKGITGMTGVGIPR